MKIRKSIIKILRRPFILPHPLLTINVIYITDFFFRAQGSENVYELPNSAR